MIQATMYHNRFEMHGHALPEEGEDYVRVCASATTLAFLLGDALDEQDKLKGYDIKTGDLTLAYQPGATAKRVADVVDCGFRRLARDYPTYIRYINCASKKGAAK